MGADCGCGGDCPMCSYFSGILIPAHRREIEEAVERDKKENPPPTPDDASSKGRLTIVK